MFRIYHSNQLDILKRLMVELIKRQPLVDPFQQEVILVQSP
ncbi:exonuclease V subunit gamma, partial [Dickeya dadantii]|nr:exonuclease V subunit gamma [Dickeya dadantii]